MVQQTTMLKVDKVTDAYLESLAEQENRSKIGELRFLIKERAKQLGVKLK